MTVDPQRHITDERLLYFLDRGQHVVRPVAGTPSARLDIDPARETLSLDIEWDGRPLASIDAYEHIATRTVGRSGVEWASITVTGSHLFVEAYPLLRTVADEVQLCGRSFNQAVAHGLGHYQELLSVSGYLSADKEIGLLGELLVFEAVAKKHGGATALDAWRGGDQKEEHDFGLPGHDIEVKTTASENRTHRISSLQQLAETERRPLWLTSVQLTRGGASGTSLPQLVERLITLIGPDDEDRFSERLHGAGFRADQPSHTYRRWTTRSATKIIRVSDQFPRLTREILNAADVPRSVITASYEIDVAYLDSSGDVPPELDMLKGVSL